MPNGKGPATAKARQTASPTSSNLKKKTLQKLKKTGEKKISFGGFDDSEGEEVCDQDPPEEPDWADLLWEEPQCPPSENDLTGRRKRLYTKTKPTGTGYTERPLVSRTCYKIQKHEMEIALLKSRSEQRSLRITAVSALANFEHAGAHAPDEGEAGTIEMPHPSHRIQAMQGGGA